MADSVHASDFKQRPYWWEAAAPEPAAERIPVPEAADIAIIGGGYAGLSAGLELARNGIKAAVLEAEAFGIGASTRNGGHVSGGVNLGKGMSGSRTKVEEMLTDAAASFTHLETIIEREKIDCHYRRSGRFVAAYASKHYDSLARRLDELNRLAHSRARMLPRAQQREEIASDFYHGGMVIEHAGQLHPALYHKGLLEAARRAGTILCDQARVERIERGPQGFTLATSRGPLRAREVIVATNGYTGPATPELRRRLIPAASHIIATEELPEDIAKSLIPKGRTISDTRRVLSYYRMSPDGRRMIYGGRARFTAVEPDKSAPILYRFMTDRFPQLRGVKITHAWTGNVAFTFDFLPHMGVHEGLHYCMGCNGSGVAMMSYLGHQTARKILGGGNRACAFDGRDFPTKPGYSGDPWFLPIVGGYYRLRDQIDRWMAR